MRLGRRAVCCCLGLWLSLMAPAGRADECPVLRMVAPDLDAFPLYSVNSETEAAHPGGIVDLTRQLAQRAGCSIRLVKLPPVRSRQALMLSDADIGWVFEQMATQAPAQMFPQTPDGQIDYAQALAVPIYLYARRADVANSDINGDGREWARGRTVGVPYGVLLIEELRGLGMRTDNSAPKREQMVKQLLAGLLDAIAIVDPTLVQRLPPAYSEQIVRFRLPALTARMLLVLSPRFQQMHPDAAGALRRQFARDGHARFAALLKQYVEGPLPPMRFDPKD